MATQGLTALTVRLPTTLYERGRTLALQRNTSLNELLTDALGAVVAQEEQAALFAAFSEVGADAGFSDVDFALVAQRDVMDGSDPNRTAVDHDA